MTNLPEITSSPDITLIGAGCASLSLAKELGAQNLATCHIKTDKSYRDRADHIWGFWQMPWLAEAAALSDHSWSQWQIITDKFAILHHSDKHPYHRISAKKWLSHCFDKARANEQVAPLSALPETPYFDSRPMAVPDGTIYQHFRGQHIKSDRAIFDDKTAILMDFRCDQSQGLHFIYLLPTSAYDALVESTLFSANLLPDAYYETAISSYLATHYELASFDITATEAGIIPLADCRDRHNPDKAIGTRGGALRPSSGYAFTFIQKQVLDIITTYRNTGQWQAKSPLSPRDYWMDKVFMAVLAKQPEISIHLFEAIATSLNGDEFAQFMSGTASYRTLFKMMMAMPKAPFIKAALLPATYQRPS